MTVAITGEAGIGKTTVIQAFAEKVAADTLVLWGACEPLQTARTLGPLFDFAHALDPAIASALRDGHTAAHVFEAVLDAVQRTTLPILMVLEDVHWADESTLDFIRFLGRRAMRLRVCLALTFRSDEVGAEHPLRLTLGDISGAHLRRIVLPPLSFEGVKTLATHAGRDPRTLFNATGGNPFFVTEVLTEREQEQEQALPQSVRDAVLARVSRLSDADRAIVNLVSVVPGRLEKVALQRIVGTPADTALQTCLHLGVLVLTEDAAGVRFRHELARRAVESALSAEQRVALHRAVLTTLANGIEGEVVRALHHAVALHDTDLILAFAPRAAKQAARLGAHKQAAGHYRTALDVAASVPATTQAQLYESWSYEAGLSKIDDDVIAARHRAVALWRGAGNLEKVALNLRWLSRLHWYRGERAEADQFLAESIATLEDAPASEERAWGLSVRSQMYMLAEINDQAIAWGERALAMADEVRAFEVKTHALNNMGSAFMRLGDPRGIALLEQSLAIALESGFHEQAARVYTNVASVAVRRFDLALAQRFALEGLAFDQKYDLDSWTHYLEGVHAAIAVHRGDFATALEVAQSALDVETLTSLMKTPARRAIAEITLLTDGERAGVEIADLLTLALKMGEPQYVVPCLILAMKLSWISGKPEDMADALDPAHIGAVEMVDEWIAGEFYFWKKYLGPSDADVVSRKIAEPFALQFAGNVTAAAEAWRALGAPVYEAMALSEGDDKQLQHAIEQLEELGALAFASRLRETPRGRALSKRRRGPYSAAKLNAQGLTAKETDVLHHMALGKSNGDIAESLFRSVKTVEHHASAVLGKLGAKTRQEAVAKARQLGLIAP